MKKTKILKYVIIGSCVLIVVVFLTVTFTKHVTKETNKNISLKEVAEKRAKEIFDDIFAPNFLKRTFGVFKSGYGLEIVEIRHPLIDELVKNHTIFKAFAQVRQPPVMRIIAVGNNDKKTFLLPEEFNSVIKRENLRIDGKKSVLNIVNLYLLLGSRMKIIILSSYKDIPYLERIGKDPGEYINRIRPPTVQVKEEKWEVNLYLWRELGGILEKWNFHVSPEGIIIADEEKIGRKIGDYSELE